MFLQGSVSGFSLSEIFKLVGVTGKTGSLSVMKDDKEGIIYFKDGYIATTRINDDQAPLGIRLVDSGLITADCMRQALEVCEGNENRGILGEVLVEHGFIESEILKDFAYEQVQDSLFEIFSWNGGNFDFKLDETPEALELDIHLGVEDAILETEKRLAEWDQIREVVPSMSATVIMSMKPVGFSGDITVKPSEWRILAVLGEGKSVEQIRSELHLTSLSVCRAVAALVNSRLLEIASIEEGQEPEAEEKVIENISKRKYVRPDQSVSGSPDDVPAEWRSYYARLDSNREKASTVKSAEENQSAG